MDAAAPVRQIEGERRKLLGLILFRILIITVLMGSTTILNLRTGQVWTPVQKLILYSIGVVYLLSIFYLLAVKYNSSYRFQAIAQLFADVMFWSSLIYLTGGLHSPFTFLYTLSIIHGSILLGKRGAYVTCLMSFACFGVIIWFENYHIFHSSLELTKSFNDIWNTRELYQIFLNLCMFAFVTALAVRLAAEVESREAALVTQRISLKVQQMLNRSIMAGINSGFVMIDRDGDITFMNVPAERLIGLTHNEAKGRNLSDIFPKLSEDVDREIRGESWKRYAELKLDTDSENPQFLTFTFSNLLGGENDRVGSMVVIDDITERRRLEESLFRNQKLAAIGELAAGIAHEIRNPLASISGSIQMLRAEFPPGGDNEKLAEIILRETDRLNHLIDDFLSYARPRPVDLLPINLHEIMEDITELLAQHPSASAVRIRVEYERIPEMSGDAGQIRQMLWNILKNAVEAAAGKTPGVVWVTIGAAPEAPDKIRFSIRDNGAGMSSDVQERIFDPFFTTKSSGTGLGMAIVYQVVKNHQGSIEVNSEPNSGTRFVITIPCHTHSNSDDAQRSA